MYICRKPLINITIHLASGWQSGMYLEVDVCLFVFFLLCVCHDTCHLIAAFMCDSLVDHASLLMAVSQMLVSSLPRQHFWVPCCCLHPSWIAGSPEQVLGIKWCHFWSCPVLKETSGCCRDWFSSAIVKAKALTVCISQL